MTPLRPWGSLTNKDVIESGVAMNKSQNLSAVENLFSSNDQIARKSATGC